MKLLMIKSSEEVFDVFLTGSDRGRQGTTKEAQQRRQGTAKEAATQAEDGDDEGVGRRWRCRRSRVRQEKKAKISCTRKVAEIRASLVMELNELGEKVLYTSSGKVYRLLPVIMTLCKQKHKLNG